MKKLLSITLLIIAVLLGLCKEESSISRIEKGTTKKVNALSYTFNSTQNEDGGTVKSGTSTDSTKAVSPIERKVISVDTWEEGGETFVASLIEENDPIATKAPTQKVNGSSVYTFYAYKDSKIKLQTVAPKGTFDVPVDEATNYGMIFLSSAKGMENPNTITSPTINESKKEITYNAKFNENVCYASFDKVKMSPGNPIDVTFTPVFSQLGIYVPSKVTGTTITVEKVRLVSGGQQEATVKVVYNSNATNNIDVTYNDNLANYAVDLTHKLNPIDNITYLESNGKQGYYNIIPNNNPAQVYIKLTAAGITKPMEKTIEFKNTASKPISFSSGKRYTIKIENGVTPHIEVTPADDKNLVAPYTTGDIILKYGLTQQLKAELVYPDKTTRVDITNNAGTTWSSNSTASVDNTTADKGLVTLIKVGTSKITATYQGVSGTATIKPQIYRAFTINDYYQWDAYEHYDTNNGTGYYIPWGPGSSSYHRGYVKPATEKFRSTASAQDVYKYYGNGVYWSKTDGLIFTVEQDGTGGKLYCHGAWLMKQGNWDLTATPKSSVKPTQGHPPFSEISQWFFLPSCGIYGGYHNGAFSIGGMTYWTSTPGNSSNGGLHNAFKMSCSASGTSVSITQIGYTNPTNPDHYSYTDRNFGLVPLAGFDDTYVVRIQLTPIDTDNLDASSTPTTGNYVYKFGLQHKFKAEAVYSDNSRMEITTSATWSAKGATSNGGGVVTITSEATATVTATFRGKSANVTIKPLIWKRFTPSMYVQWTESNVVGAISPDEHKMYLAEGVHWSETDGYIFILPNGKLYCNGLWMKKSHGSGSEEIVTPIPNRPPDYANYFFLPASGEYTDTGSSRFGTGHGHYWLSMPYNNYDGRYTCIQGTQVDLSHVPRNYKFIPLIPSNFY